MTGFITAWTKHLKTDKEKADFEKLVRNSTQVLSRLRTLLEERELELDAEEMNDKFESPAWPYLEASRIGRRAEIRKTKSLLNFIG